MCLSRLRIALSSGTCVFTTSAPRWHVWAVCLCVEGTNVGSQKCLVTQLHHCKVLRLRRGIRVGKKVAVAVALFKLFFLVCEDAVRVRSIFMGSSPGKLRSGHSAAPLRQLSCPACCALFSDMVHIAPFVHDIWAEDTVRV